MPATTNLALAKRAVRAAVWCDRRYKDLTVELNKQSIDPATYYDKDNTMSLPVHLVVAMIVEMAKIRDEIRSFKAPAGSL